MCIELLVWHHLTWQSIIDIITGFKVYLRVYMSVMMRLIGILNKLYVVWWLHVYVILIVVDVLLFNGWLIK